MILKRISKLKYNNFYHFNIIFNIFQFNFYWYEYFFDIELFFIKKIIYQWYINIWYINLEIIYLNNYWFQYLIIILILGSFQSKNRKIYKFWEDNENNVVLISFFISNR